MVFVHLIFELGDHTLVTFSNCQRWPNIWIRPSPVHASRDPMLDGLSVIIAALSSAFRTHAALRLENLALRHQIGVLQRSTTKRPKLTAADRFLWAWLCGVWSDWRSALVIVKPETVIA